MEASYEGGQGPEGGVAPQMDVIILQWLKGGSGPLLPSSLSHDLVSFSYTALPSF